MSEPWTEAHRREAAVFLLEEMRRRWIARGRLPASSTLLVLGASEVESESEFRLALDAELGFLAAEQDRAVHRVHALAEHRLLREQERRVHVYDADGERVDMFAATDPHAKHRLASAVQDGLRVARVRVTRVRRTK